MSSKTSISLYAAPLTVLAQYYNNPYSSATPLMSGDAAARVSIYAIIGRIARIVKKIK